MTWPLVPSTVIQSPLRVLGHRPDKLVGEPVEFPEVRPFAVVQAIQAGAFRADPESSVLGGRYRQP